MKESSLTRRDLSLVAGAVVVATIVAYGPSFSVPFQFDDYARITGNWNLHAGNWARAIGQLGGSRVLPSSTIAFDFWMSGESTFGYHVTNLLVHLAATAAVFYLALQITRTPRMRESSVAARPLLFVGAAAAVFALHPLQTQGVTYIIQRSSSMATAFYVAAVGAYVAARLAQLEGESGRRFFAAALAFSAAALLSKENAVTIPAAIAVTEVAFFGSRHLGRLFRLGLLAAPVLALPAVFKIVAWRFRRGQQTGDGFFDAIFAQGTEGVLPDSPGPIDYFLTQMLVIPRYLRLALFPVGLNVDHHVRAVEGVDGGVVAGALLLLALLVLAVAMLRTVPVAGCAILWIFIALSVESSFIPLHDAMMEHRMYLAMPGVALLFAAAACRLGVIDRRAALLGTLAVAGLLAALTFSRNQVWQSARALWSDAASKSPNKARVHVNVGVAYHTEDNLDMAIEHYCRAIELDSQIPIARENIEVALEQQGRLDDVMAQLEPVPVAMPGAPKGTVVLEYDVSEVVCAPD